MRTKNNQRKGEAFLGADRVSRSSACVSAPTLQPTHTYFGRKKGTHTWYRYFRLEVIQSPAIRLTFKLIKTSMCPFFFSSVITIQHISFISSLWRSFIFTLFLLSACLSLLSLAVTQGDTPQRVGLYRGCQWQQKCSVMASDQWLVLMSTS